MAYKNIVLKGDPIRKEGVAGGAVTPGHLVQGVGTLVVHATAGGVGRRYFAQENDLVGDDISTAYASGDTVQANVHRPGDEVLAWLKDGNNVTAGTALESAGDGTLRTRTGSNTIVGWALEAKNASGSNLRIAIEVA